MRTHDRPSEHGHHAHPSSPQARALEIAQRLAAAECAVIDSSSLPVTAAALTAVGVTRCRLVHPKVIRMGGGKLSALQAAGVALDLAAAALEESSDATIGVGVCDGGDDRCVVAVQSDAGPIWLEVPLRPHDLYGMAETALRFAATAAGV